MRYLIVFAILVFITAIGFFAGYIAKSVFNDTKDDGVIIINNERVEVIFRDPYEKLVKKKYVNLRIQS